MDAAVFTDPQAALEEMKYLAEDTGEPHAVVSVMQVVSYTEARQRDLPILETYTSRKGQP